MLTENICCNYHWYEGVNAVPGTAPCSKHNKQVLWNEDCDEIWLIPERLKIKKENHMSIIINGIKMPEAPDEIVYIAICGNGTVIQTGESWRSPKDGKCYYTTTTPEKFGNAVSVQEHEAADAIEELWIPVTERLPPAEKEVYVTDGEYIARANLLDEVFPGDKPCWSYSGLGEITHWCEQIQLPQQPKEE